MIKPLSRLLPALLLVVVVLDAGRAEAQNAVMLEPAVGVNAMRALVEHQLESARSSLRILAATEDIQSGDWNRIKGPLAILAEAFPDSAAVAFVRPDGSYFTVESDLIEQNLKDRSYFPRLMAGEEVEGDLVISKSTGQRSAFVAAPIERDGRVVGALGISMAMEKMAALVDRELGLPETVAFFALDRHGQAALHRQSALIFEFPAEMEGAGLKAAVQEMLTKPEGTVRYEFQGAARQTFFKRSNVTGWIYALRW